MFDSLKRLFGRQRQAVNRRSLPPKQYSYDVNNLPLGSVPIESSFDLTPVPGTMLQVGPVARVFQTSTNELVTAQQTVGIRLRCDHHVYSVHQIITAGGVQPGIGGVCDDCRLEAAALAARNLILPHQIDEFSLYCTMCASHCDACGRKNICIRHTQQFQSPEGQILTLCPTCLKQAEHDNFFRKVLSVMLAPLIDHRHLPDHTERTDRYGY